MIQANELRIGNWIQSRPMSIPRLQITSNGMMKVTGYGISVLESDTSNKLCWEPIPITREILDKCGFKQLEMYQEGHLGLNGVRVVQHLGEWQWNDMTRNKTLTSLHQLQNIYHALTGEELTIKL